MKQQSYLEKVIHTLLTDLKCCCTRRDIQWGRRIHAKAVEVGDDCSIYFLTALTKMYANCGNMRDARLTFDSIQLPDVVSWNVLILGYADNAEGLVALEMFSRMKVCRCQPDSATYVAALKAVSGFGKSSLHLGKQIHLEVGKHLDYYVGNTLIYMYAKCGSMVDARKVFDGIERPDVVAWTALLLGYAENGEGRAALQLFSTMKAQGCIPNSVTYVAVLKACTSVAMCGGDKRDCLNYGRKIHSEIGCHLNRYVQSSLIEMYAKCGSMGDARGAFECMSKTDVVGWNTLLMGYADNGDGHSVMDLLPRMEACGCFPNASTHVAALKACICLATNEDGKRECLERGRKIHSATSHPLDPYVESTLIVLYVKCGSMVEAQNVFDLSQKVTMVSWTVLLLGYAENGEGSKALELFSRMKLSGCAMDSVTYIAAIKACTCLAMAGDANSKGECLERGREIHLEIGCHLNLYVQSALVYMYAKCGSMVDSHKVFDDIHQPDVVPWNALLLGYVENGEGRLTLDLFSRMKVQHGCLPNSLTYVAALRACSLIGALEVGRKFHLEITDFTDHVVTCLVDFYAKCGSMDEAYEVFDSHRGVRGVATWNALFSGYASFGERDSVFELFERMKCRPDAVTFLCVLLCCSHAGLVEKASEYFKAMCTQYGITPTVMHYTCMVDTLGRACQLGKAMAMVQKMPCKPDAITWLSLLGASKKWKNFEIERLAHQSLLATRKSVSRIQEHKI